MAKPNFFIVGAPKCGTSSMHEYLAQHPDVFLPRIKEPIYFGRDLEVNSIWCVRDEGKYHAMFEGAGDAKRVGDSTTWYMYSETAAREIKAYEPAAKVVMMIRNPIDAMYSLHGQFLWSANENISDFEEAIEAEAERASGRRIPPECVMPKALQYTKVFSFAEQVRRYFDAFGRENCLVLVYEDLVRDTPGCYRQVAEFLGLDSSFEPKFEVVNAAKPVNVKLSRFFARRPWLRKLLHAAMPTTLMWKVAAVLPYLMPTLKRPGKISPKMRAKLIPRFREDVEKLSALLGRDLTHWCSNAAGAEEPEGAGKAREGPAGRAAGEAKPAAG